MCKNGALPNSDKDRHQNAETVNVGLINSSTTSFNKFPIWEMIEIISLLILILLLIRWVRKYWKKKNRLTSANRQDIWLWHWTSKTQDRFSFTNLRHHWQRLQLNPHHQRQSEPTISSVNHQLRHDNKNHNKQNHDTSIWNPLFYVF